MTGFLLDQFEILADAPGGVQRLRELILQLAVTGRLGTGDEKDEPASELIKNINYEKDKLIKKGILKEKKSQTIQLFQPYFDIPSGWIWIRLEEIVSKIGSGSTPLGGKNAYSDSGIKFIRSQNVWNDGLFLKNIVYISNEIHQTMAGTHVQPFDVLLNITGASIGRSCVVPKDFDKGNVNQHVCIIRPIIQDISNFIHLFLISKTLQEFIMSVQVGISREGLSAKQIRDFLIPLPPLAEQKRIVEKVDSLMALCDDLEAKKTQKHTHLVKLGTGSLNALQQSTTEEELIRWWGHLQTNFGLIFDCVENVEALRQTILQLAVTGRLGTGDEGDEPVTIIFRKIIEKKQKLLAKGAIQKDKQLSPLSLEDPPNRISDHWKWVRLQDIFEITRGGSPRPSGDPLFFGGTIPWITVGEITKDNNKFLHKVSDTLTELGSQRSRFVYPNDLLLTNSGATLGVPKISKIQGCINDGVAKLYDFHGLINHEYAYYYLKSETSAFRSVNQGMGQPNLNTSIMAGWFFPLPPIGEQKRIVEKLDHFMHLCDQLEKMIENRTKSSKSLSSAIVQQIIPVS